jgi:hypothetical protein
VAWIEDVKPKGLFSGPVKGGEPVKLERVRWCLGPKDRRGIAQADEKNALKSGDFSYEERAA